MSQDKKAPSKPRNYRSNPPLVGFVHNAHFNAQGVTTAPISEAEVTRLRETFEGVEFTAIEEQQASASTPETK